jgi:hypothetical protein
MAKRKRTDIVALKLRLREALRKRLELAAKGGERSLNSEIVARLEQSFDRESLTDLHGKVQGLMGAVIDRLEHEKRRALKDPMQELAPDDLEQLYEIRLEENRRTERVLLEAIRRLRDERGDVRRTALQQSKGE